MHKKTKWNNLGFITHITVTIVYEKNTKCRFWFQYCNNDQKQINRNVSEIEIDANVIKGVIIEDKIQDVIEIFKSI